MKKIFTLILVVMLVSTNVFAFQFPEPDWGALLKEKTQMVNETDFELYVEGPVNSSPYYGAKLEPVGGTYFGMIAENSEFVSPVGSYLTYFSMESGQTDMYYPANDLIGKGNSVATVGYVVSSLDSVNYDVIKRSLDTLASYNKPMFIRFANEMNVSPIGDDPERYVEVFRKVADMVHQYPDFAVVWSPNDLGGLDRPFEYYYPGDQYVDWIGISSYMKKYFQGNPNTQEKDTIYFMTGDYAWATNAIKPIVKFMQDNNINKPVMLSECGVSTENNVDGEDSVWATPRFRNLYYNLIMKYPQVKLINYFNTYRNEAERYYVCDTHNSLGTQKEYAKNILKEAVNSGAYIRQYGAQPDFVYAPASAGHTLKAENGIVNLYTLAYIPKNPDISVNYRIDGNWVHSSTEIPYTFKFDVNSVSDGEHTVTIESAGLSKTYSFHKNGQTLSFGDIPPTVPEKEVSLTLDGSPIPFVQAPFIEGGRTLVPLRAIFEALDATVKWDDTTQTVTSSRGDKTVRLTIGSNVMYINGEEKILDVPAKLVNDGYTFVPARAVTEAFGYKVNWNEALWRVEIITQ